MDLMPGEAEANQNGISCFGYDRWSASLPSTVKELNRLCGVFEELEISIKYFNNSRMGLVCGLRAINWKELRRRHLGVIFKVNWISELNQTAFKI